MLHDLVWDLQTQLHGEERRVCSRSQPPELEVICDAANVSACSIGSLIDHSIDVVGESPDETSLSGFTCDFDGVKPESTKTNLIKRGTRKTYREPDILSSDLGNFRFTLRAFHVRISENICH